MTKSQGKAKLFGPGAIVALIGALAVVGYSYWTGSAPAPRASHLPSPTGPLRKPTPGTLLGQPWLMLKKEQREQISAIEAAWQRKKAELESAMANIQPQQGTLNHIQDQMASYSDLSRQYEMARVAAWNDAIQLLNDEQIRKVSP